MIDIDQLCGALGPDSPAGPTSEYDADFIALQVAQEGKPERQYGETIIPPESPDWKRVYEDATSIAQRTRDLRIAVALTRALTHLHGLQGMVSGMQMTDRLCRDLWEHVHPLLDKDEGDDPTMRMNALAPLADHNALLSDIRDSVFAAARGMGSCTVRQLEIALGMLAPAGNDAQGLPSMSEIDGLVGSACAQGSFGENWPQRGIDLAQGLQAYLVERVGAVMAPDFSPLVARLRPLAEYARKFTSAREQATEALAEAQMATQGQVSAAALAAGLATPVAAQSAAALPAEIRSSSDAVRMLELVCAYFEKHEPTNPAPLLLRRAQRLSSMTFYDIVRDIAPDAISAVEMVAGSRDNPS